MSQSTVINSQNGLIRKATHMKANTPLQILEISLKGPNIQEVYGLVWLGPPKQALFQTSRKLQYFTPARETARVNVALDSTCFWGRGGGCNSAEGPERGS